MRTVILIAAIGALSLAACGSKDEAATDRHGGVKMSIKTDSDNDSSDSATDEKSTKMALNLPGGLNFDVDVPGKMADGSKFDIDGVGLYPGAKVRAVDIDAQGGKTPSVVTIGFVAPGDAAAVADWYQKQFQAKGVAASRSGESFAGTSEDGDSFTLAMTAAGIGKSRGLLTITDKG
jgi:hypothetical protein